MAEYESLSESLSFCNTLPYVNCFLSCVRCFCIRCNRTISSNCVQLLMAPSLIYLSLPEALCFSRRPLTLRRSFRATNFRTIVPLAIESLSYGKCVPMILKLHVSSILNHDKFSTRSIFDLSPLLSCVDLASTLASPPFPCSQISPDDSALAFGSLGKLLRTAIPRLFWVKLLNLQIM